MRERAAHFFTPMMIDALGAMRRGPLVHTPLGWVSGAGTWNSHTIGYLARVSCCEIEGDRATITQHGRDQFIRYGDLYA